MTDPPRAPADPRPDNEPYYTDADCPKCGTALEAADPEWHDEWICPECEDGVHLDWPPEHRRQLAGRIDASEFVPLEEV